MCRTGARCSLMTPLRPPVEMGPGTAGWIGGDRQPGGGAERLVSPEVLHWRRRDGRNESDFTLLYRYDYLISPYSVSRTTRSQSSIHPKSHCFCRCLGFKPHGAGKLSPSLTTCHICQLHNRDRILVQRVTDRYEAIAEAEVTKLRF